VLLTRGDPAIDEFYRVVAPFYKDEVRDRGDIPEWIALARRIEPRRILDLGCGGGRIATAMHADDPHREVVGLDLSTALLEKGELPFTFVHADMRDIPLDEEFDLIVAANDPFAHLLEDEDRRMAVAEARRLLARDGLLVIDGCYVPPQDEARAALPDGLIRERAIAPNTRMREVWRGAGEHRYDARYEYFRDGEAPVVAAARLRAWHCGEDALRECGARIAGGLDERDFDPWGSRLVAVVPGWS
jgi:SAM-dependent methyltransferase